MKPRHSRRDGFEQYPADITTASGLRDGIVGLRNNSLYCYMNACLQCLFPIDELRDYYLN